MKTVVHIIDEKVVVSEVPDEWIRCSVTGEFRPFEEFCGDGKDYQTRTNCTRAYMMPLSEWDYYKGVRKRLAPEIERIQDKLYHWCQEKSAGSSIDEMVAMLLELKDRNPNARIVFRDEDNAMHEPIVRISAGFSNVYEITQ